MGQEGLARDEDGGSTMAVKVVGPKRDRHERGQKDGGHGREQEPRELGCSSTTAKP